MADLPATMTAIAIEGKGGPEVLIPVDLPMPLPGQAQVLIKVAAAGINRPDIMQRQGLYPAPQGHSEIPGLEVAGVVAATGSGADRFKPGHKVMALVNGGGYAEYCLAEQACCLPVPAGLPMEQAGGFAETFFTVWHNVFERAHLTSGEWFMIHGGTSGIGVTAIQLAKAFGANVIATAGSDEKCAACSELGADVAVNYRTEDFVEKAKAATGRPGVNVILDMVGGDYVARNYSAAAQGGRIVQIAFLRGAKAEADLARLMLKQLTHTGSTLRSRRPEQKAEIARALEDRVWPLIDQKLIAPVIDTTFALNDAAKAHERMESGEHFGKIMLKVA